ncbi:MAG: hypothetical protein IID39_05825 [Planctomycetes bacterium]|nr:hypothetical protein [Planctomycetota bacterium]
MSVIGDALKKAERGPSREIPEERRGVPLREISATALQDHLSHMAPEAPDRPTSKEVTRPATPDHGLRDWLAVLIVVVVTSGLLGVLRGYVNQRVGQGVMFRLRTDLHDHLQRLPVRFYTQTRTGEILSRVSTDVNGVQQAVTGTFTEFLMNAITLLVAITMMFVLEWRLALVALVVLPLWVYPTIRVGLVQRRLMRE